MWRLARKAVTTALALGVGGGAATIATSEDPAKALKICTHLPPRLLRDSVAAATIAFDYHYSLWGLDPGSKAWQDAKHQTHLRSANILQDLCFRNGGIYIKLGQHIAQLVRNPGSLVLRIDLGGLPKFVCSCFRSMWCLRSTCRR
jgi:aarF domain-containing kinase